MAEPSVVSVVSYTLDTFQKHLACIGFVLPSKESPAEQVSTTPVQHASESEVQALLS